MSGEAIMIYPLTKLRVSRLTTTCLTFVICVLCPFQFASGKNKTDLLSASWPPEVSVVVSQDDSLSSYMARNLQPLVKAFGTRHWLSKVNSNNGSTAFLNLDNFHSGPLDRYIWRTVKLFGMRDPYSAFPWYADNAVWTIVDYENSGHDLLVTQDERGPATWDADISKLRQQDWSYDESYAGLLRYVGPAMGDCHDKGDPLSQPLYYVGGELNSASKLCSGRDITHPSYPDTDAMNLQEDLQYRSERLGIGFIRLKSHIFTAYGYRLLKTANGQAAMRISIVDFTAKSYVNKCELLTRIRNQRRTRSP